MTWTKLSDDYSDDCWTLSDAAFRLHTEALIWNGRKLLDLRIPKEELRRFAKTPESATELLAVGWWTDEGDAYVIRHHGAYQRTRAEVLAQQAANVANGRRGGRPRKVPREITEMPPARETQSVSESLSQSVSGSVSGSVPAPVHGTERQPPVQAGSHAQETQSLSDSLSHSKSERDRTGSGQEGSIEPRENLDEDEAMEALREYRGGLISEVTS